MNCLTKLADSAAAEASSQMTVLMYAKLLGAMVGLLVLVYLLAELTPKIASFIDKTFNKVPDYGKETKPEDYKTYDYFSGEAPEDDETEDNQNENKEKE